MKNGKAPGPTALRADDLKRYLREEEARERKQEKMQGTMQGTMMPQPPPSGARW